MKNRTISLVAIAAALSMTAGCARRTLPPEPPSSETPVDQVGSEVDQGQTGAAVPGSRADFLQSVVSRSEVKFKKLTPAEIAAYVDSGECDDKAGAYAIQGRAARFVVELRGSYSGVMGLPLYETAQLLDKLPQRK